MDDILGDTASAIGVQKSCMQPAAATASNSSESITASDPPATSTAQQQQPSTENQYQGQLNDAGISHLPGFSHTSMSSGIGRRQQQFAVLERLNNGRL